MNVRIKKIAAVVLLMLLTFASVPYAYSVGDWKARYIIQNDSYNSDDKTYTAEVYLSTSEYLSEGTFGLAYDSAIAPEFKLNKELFDEVYNFSENGRPYTVVSWYRKDVGYLKQEVLLGTIKVENVEWDDDRNIPKNWNQKTLRQLEWRTTATSQLPEYNDDFGGITINREIWRDFDEAEKEEFKEYGVTGCYQGVWWPELTGAPNEWVDIWFEFNSNFDLPEQEGQILTGEVQSYNPNNKVSVRLLNTDGTIFMQSEPSYTNEGPECIMNCFYEFTAVPDGEYTLEISKDVHLTYRTGVKVEGADVTVPKIKLYCGDISGDERIKLNDRSTLMLYLNKRLYDSDNTTAVRCDLNGDGKITFHDLDILKIYYNKNYGGEA